MFIFVKLACWFSSLNMMYADFCSWNLLQVDYFFKKRNVSWFLSLRNLLDFYLFFMKLAAFWFSSSWNLYFDFFFSWNRFCSWNFLLFVSCSIHFVSCFLFVLDTFCALIYCTWNKMYVDFFFVKLLAGWFFFVKLVARLFLFFVKHDACWFLFLNHVACGLFLQETRYIFIASWWYLLHTDFSLRKTFRLIFFLLKPILIVELVACWFMFMKLHSLW